jgi:hypothetical protein
MEAHPHIARPESLLETLEILGDPELMVALGEAEQDVEAGRLTPIGEATRESGLA